MVDEDIDENDEDDQGELEDEFDEYTMPGGPQAPAVSSRLIHTVPAKEPNINAVPLKPALKKPKGQSTTVQVSSRNSNHNDKNNAEVQITSR